MAVKTCTRCNQEFKKSDGCLHQVCECDGKKHAPVVYGDEAEGWITAGRLPLPRCPECGVLVKQVHHKGCSEEVCSYCHHKSVTCGCRMKPIEVKAS